MADTKTLPRGRKMRLLAAFAALAVAGCGDDPAQPRAPVAAPASSTTTAAAPSHEDGPGRGPPPPPHADKPSGPADNGEADPRRALLEREAERTVRAYVQALDDHDGARVCALLAPGAIDEVELPVARGGCGASLSASIGYRDPRGLPVWRSARVASVRAVRLDPAQAKMLITVATRFADRDELSIEDDVVYLVRDENSWLIAKPSATFYRAIGVGDIPASVISPPSG
jgi:hypothetical protein